MYWYIYYVDLWIATFCFSSSLYLLSLPIFLSFFLCLSHSLFLSLSLMLYISFSLPLPLPMSHVMSDASSLCQQVMLRRRATTVLCLQCVSTGGGAEGVLFDRPPLVNSFLWGPRLPRFFPLLLMRTMFHPCAALPICRWRLLSFVLVFNFTLVLFEFRKSVCFSNYSFLLTFHLQTPLICLVPAVEPRSL